MELLKRYIDYDFIFWPLKLNFENFKMFKCLNNTKSFTVTFENSETIYEN